MSGTGFNLSSIRQCIGHRAFAAVLAASVVMGATAARADETTSQTENNAGIDVAAGVVSLVYTPAKVLYALSGGVAAGMAYLASAGDPGVTEPILTPSLRGDYIVTPAHLRGDEPLEFFGRPASDATQHAEAPAVSSGDGLDGATTESAEAGSESATE